MALANDPEYTSYTPDELSERYVRTTWNDPHAFFLLVREVTRKGDAIVTTVRYRPFRERQRRAGNRRAAQAAIAEAERLIRGAAQ